MIRFSIYCIICMGLLHCLHCEPDTSDTQSQLRHYRRTVDLATMAERNEGNTTKSLLVEHTVDLVKKTAEFRVQIALHKNNVFGRMDNEQWRRCVTEKHELLQAHDNSYATEESSCLRRAQAAVTGKKRGVKQIAKEIRNWRKGYKYITSVCRDRNAWNRTETGECIVRLMSNDNYIDTATTLLDLLRQSQQELRNQTIESLLELQDCLSESLSTFLTGLRAVMAELDICYRRRVDKTAVDGNPNPIDCFKLSDFKCSESN